MIAAILLTVISFVLCGVFSVLLYFLISKLVKKQKPERKDVVKTVVFGSLWIITSVANVFLILFVAW